MKEAGRVGMDEGWFGLSRCAFVDHGGLLTSMRLLLVWAIKMCFC